ncbi:Aste57867_11288 [Aphanomyces stellatus]|uniref:Aste57867_11288 protein n=1 Tax=Aphanomyces stellatus TaxID=120398 RepID=A0A485KSH9_9STRA|nr:hypothetical protein As57867_011246 [Aphanomyces stellatus]VFT88150.1 Aste57867_11288 [Aphanomyces stellatus]
MASPTSNFHGLRSPVGFEKRHPLDGAGLFAKAGFTWASSLLQLGNTRQLEPSDIWALQDTNKVAPLLARYWMQYERKDRAILRAFFSLYGSRLVLIGVLQLVSAACDMYGPAFVLPQIVATVEHRPMNWTNGILLAISLFVVQVANAFLKVHMSFANNVIGIQFSAILRSMIFQKALQLDAKGRKAKNAGDIANLFAVDVVQVQNFALNLNAVWIVPVQMLFTLYLIECQVGWAIYIGLIALALILLVSMVFGVRTGASQRRILAAKDDRMQVVSELFGAIQIVKFNAWEEKFVARVEALRTAETLQEAFLALPSTFVSMLQALVSTKRIADVLAMDEISPDNIVSPDDDVLVAKQWSEHKTVVAITDGSFGWTRETRPLLSTSSGASAAANLSSSTAASAPASRLSARSFSAKCTKSVDRSLSAAKWRTLPSSRGSKTPRSVKTFSLPNRTILSRHGGLPRRRPHGNRPQGRQPLGGQRARLSLARACYSDADIFVLDAPLAALDAIVAAHVFQTCFLGLLKHKTIILVTHNPDVSESPAIDRSFLLQDGRLVESTHDKPRTRPPPPVSPLSARRGYWEDATVIPSLRANDLLVSPSASTPHPVRALVDIWTPRHSTSVLGDDLPSASLVVEEARAEGRVSKEVVMGYVDAIGGWLALAAMLAATVATEGLRVGSDIRTRRSNTNLLVYSVLVFSMCVLTLVQLAVVFFFGLKGSKALFRQMLDGVIQAPMRFFDTNPIGRILNRFGDDILQCDIMIPMSFAPIMVETAAALSKLVTTVAIVQFMGLLLPPLIYIYVKLGAYYLGPLRELNRIKKTTLSPLLSLVSQSVEGSVTIRAFGSRYQRRFFRLHDQAIETYSASCFAAVALNQWFNLRVQLVSNSIVFAILLGAIFMNGSLSAGVIGLAISYGLTIPANLSSLVGMWANLETALIAPERVHEYAHVPSEGARETTTTTPAQLWPTDGAITFDNVSFRYKDDDPLVLKHVSFAIRAGEKIGVVGRTGAGKSSLMMTLFRINEVATGTIRIDGVDTATLGLKQLRSALAIIPQNPVLFKGTLRNYLDPFDDYDDDALWTALRKINMTERIAAEEDKLLQAVEENGENFSVGERQMLCMARAMLQRAKIVVLDEATAAMDHDTDQLLQNVVRVEFAQSTVLTIAHRLDTVLDYDRIMVYERGELVQCDTPEALIGQADGIFFDMIMEGGYLDRI